MCRMEVLDFGLKHNLGIPNSNIVFSGSSAVPLGQDTFICYRRAIKERVRLEHHYLSLIKK